jgi:hypothetical protein
VEARYIASCWFSFGHINMTDPESKPEFEVCPVVGMGLFLTLLDVPGLSAPPSPEQASDAAALALRTSHLHADAALMLMTRWGLFFSGELGVMLYVDSLSGQLGLVEVPGFRVGMLFK